MGCGQSKAHDDKIEERNIKIERTLAIRRFHFRHMKGYAALENAIAILVLNLNKQQLSQETWKLIQNLRCTITAGSPGDDKLYYESGPTYKGI